MRPQTPVGPSSKDSIIQLLSKTKKKSDFQRVQCVWLRLQFGMDASTVAKITHLKSGTVRKIWSNYLRFGDECLIAKNRGGRRNHHLEIDDEKVLLAPYLKKEQIDNIKIIAEVKAAFEKKTGKKVHKSTIYRLLERHGWRKKSSLQNQDQKIHEKKAELFEYWIDGCSKALVSERRGNISWQWLNTTLEQMAGAAK